MSLNFNPKVTRVLDEIERFVNVLAKMIAG